MPVFIRNYENILTTYLSTLQEGEAWGAGGKAI